MNTPDLTKLIQSAIEQRVSEVIEEEVKVAAMRVETRVRGEVGSIAAKVLQRFNFETCGTQLVIRVEFDEKKGNP